MASKKSIIIVGSSLGAWKAARSARRFDDDAQIVVIEEEGHSEAFGLKNFCLINNITVRRGHLLWLDPDANCIMLAENGKQERLHYDALIFLGSVKSVDCAIAGLSPSAIVSVLDIANVCKTLKSAIVLGADLAGIEVALRLRHAGLMVTIIDKRKRALPSFSLLVSHAVIAKLKEESITTILDDHPTRGHAHDGSVSLITERGRNLNADVLINAQGLCPQLGLLADAGCALDPDGFVRVDDSLATTLPNVYACGPAIKTPVVRSHERKWFLSPDIVEKTAFIAGKNAVSKDKTTLSAVCETTIIAIAKTHFARTGLSEEEARKLYGAEQLTIITVYEKEYSSCVRLLFKTDSQEIIGAEVFGDFNVEGRIGILSQAVRDAFTVDRVLDMDMKFTINDGRSEPLREAAERAHYHFLKHLPLISVDTLLLWLAKNRDFRLIDVGDTPYFPKMRVKQMAHVPLARFCELNDLPLDEEPIVLYAACSEQSHMAQRALLHRGFKNVYHLDGGVLAFSMLFSEER